MAGQGDAEDNRETLDIDKLVSGDVPSLLVVGTLAADSFRKHGAAFFAADVLGRVHVLHPSSVTVTRQPRVIDPELDTLPVDEALDVMVRQGDSSETMTKYLARRPE